MRSSIFALLLRRSGGICTYTCTTTSRTTKTTRLVHVHSHSPTYHYLSSTKRVLSSSSSINNNNNGGGGDRGSLQQKFSTTAAVVNISEESDDENENDNDNDNKRIISYPCGSPGHEDDFGHLPPPLPEPKYSVHKRILPAQLTPMSSNEGRKRLLESLTNNTGESYWPLIEQFVSQSDPAYCGVTTLMMTLNAFCIDPQIRWRGGWRFYGDEQVLLDRCCLSNDRIKRVGLTLEEFRLLGRCHGLNIELKRPEEKYYHQVGSRKDDIYTLENFRNDIRNVLIKKEEESDHSCSSFYEKQQQHQQQVNEAEDQGRNNHHHNSHHHHHDALIVVSYSRSYLGQTGDGHFSPIAAYHEPTDSVLVLDVARFKYAPYWVSVESLYGSMKEKDTATNRSRGWFVMKPPKNHSCHSGTPQEDRRPAELVRLVGEEDSCPVNKIKVDFCKVNSNNNKNNHR